MSRMTKFLRQYCFLEKYIEEDGHPKLNDFGEVQYAAPIKVRCRCEYSHKDVQTTNGSIIRSTAVLYFDESHPIKADYRVDGKVVISVIAYTNGLGLTEGYEVYV